MALQNTITLNFTYTCNRESFEESKNIIHELEYFLIKQHSLENCYIKILNVQGNKDAITFAVGIYTNSTKEKMVDKREYSFTPDVSIQSENFIKQGYEYLKTLPGYEGAIDVLDDGQTL